MVADPVIQKKIVHVDMDAFYASVEIRDNPGLNGLPVIVAWSGPRSVVCAASYEARKFGVHSAMAVSHANRLCPQAVYVAPDFTRYRDASRQIREIFARHTDRIEPLSLDEAYLDVTTNKSGLATATEVARVIRQQIFEQTGLTASAGIAPNKFLAKIASDWNKPNGQFVIKPGQVMDFLTDLPVRKIPGVGKVMQARLIRIGVATVGDLRKHAAAELETHFGRYGFRLYELARGIDERSVMPGQPVQQVSAENTFDTDLLLTELSAPIAKLAAKVWEQGVRHGRIGCTVTLKLKTDRFRIVTRQLTAPAPPDSPELLLSIAMALCGRVGLSSRTRYRLAGVGMSNFPGSALRSQQSVLFE